MHRQTRQREQRRGPGHEALGVSVCGETGFRAKVRAGIRVRLRVRVGDGRSAIQ